MSFLKTLLADVRSAFVAMLVTGAVLVLGPVGAAIWKGFSKEAVPWTIFIVVVCVGIVLVLFAIRLTNKFPVLTEEKLILTRAQRKESRQTDDTQTHSEPLSTPRLPAQIWDEAVGLSDQANPLMKQWINGNPTPPLSETTSWISRFEAFARNNFSLEQITIVRDTSEMRFRDDLPSEVRPTSEILEVWQKFSTYQRDLRSFIKGDLRLPPPRPHVSALEQIAANIGNRRNL